jgi:hypothetical protein
MLLNHGLEYHVLVRDGLGNNQHIKVLHTSDTAKRLADSEYYNERRESWFVDIYRRCEPISDTDVVDILMTEVEKERLQLFIEIHCDNIVSHGWYDIVTDYN